MVDLRNIVRGATKPPGNIAIVAIDDRIAQDQGFPIPRSTLSHLITEIARAGPAAIAVDMLLVDPGEPADDAMLATALGESPVVLAAAAVFAGGKQWVAPQSYGPLSRVPNAERFLMPLPTFADVATLGVVNIATDQSGTPRFAPLLFQAGGQVVPSLALRVAALAAKAQPEFEGGKLSLGDRTVRTDLGYLMPLSFYGPRGSIPTISAAAVVGDNFDPSVLQNRIVVIGSTVTGGGDVFSTSFDPILPGVEVIATAIANLTSEGGIVRDESTRLIDALFALVLPLVLVALVAWRRSVVGMAAIVGVVLAWAIANLVAFSNGVWLSVALPLAAAGPPVVLFGAMQLWRDRSRAQYFAAQSRLLQQVQAPGLGKWLARHADFLQTPVRADLGVVFIDLSGFTGLSEKLGPKRHTRVAESVPPVDR